MSKKVVERLRDNIPPLKPRAGYTTFEAAKILRISRAQVYKLMASGRLRSYLLSGKRFIDDAAIDEFIENEKKASGY